jgi:hypothetical protein
MALKGLMMMGPEILPTATSSNPFKSLITGSFLGQTIQNVGMGSLSDKTPETVDSRAYSNYTKFYPAGASL